ncbi:O-antigen ligase family protein [Streptomyces ovatisporus]|uniref:O-antigen ligase family protein n=1 Tax=Streptomyces ovatisporus TaxID=1128682 RepID=A0ABV9A9Y4_9ACTN
MTSPVLVPCAVRQQESNAADIAGVLILGACAGWALVTAAGRDARPEGLLLAVLAVGAGYATGRIAGSLLPVGAAAGAAVFGVFLALFGPTSTRMVAGSIQFAGPEGRSGVTAALLTLAVGAACCAAWATPVHALRVTLRLGAAGIVVLALLIGTPVGFAAGLAVLLWSLAVGRVRRRRVPLAALALAATTVTGVTFAVAADALPHPVTTALESRLTEHRTELWEDALRLVREKPLTGTGPDTFGELSPTTHRAAGADGKPHSAPLQLAAEQGVVGLMLLAAAYVWLMAALRESPRGTPVVLTAAAALSALAALSSIGNALSFTQVTAGAALLAGTATARRPVVE